MRLTMTLTHSTLCVAREGYYASAMQYLPRHWCGGVGTAGSSNKVLAIQAARWSTNGRTKDLANYTDLPQRWV